MTYDLEQPFEIGVVAKEALEAEAGNNDAEDVLGTKSGANCPVACDMHTVNKNRGEEE